MSDPRTVKQKIADGLREVADRSELGRAHPSLAQQLHEAADRIVFLEAELSRLQAAPNRTDLSGVRPQRDLGSPSSSTEAGGSATPSASLSDGSDG